MKKQLLSTFIVCAGVAIFTFFACGGKANPGGAVCEKMAECAKKQNEEFSVSQCEQDRLFEFEDADSIGCGDQWKAIYECAVGLDCDAANDFSKFESECGGKMKDLDSCIKNAKGKGGSTGDGGVSPETRDY